MSARFAPFLAALGLALLAACGAAAPSPRPASTWTPEPIVPTRTAEPSASIRPALLTSTAEPSPTAVPSPTPRPLLTIASPDFRRFGVTGAVEDLPAAVAGGLPVANFLNWSLIPQPPVEGVTYWQTVRLRPEGVVASWDDIAAAVAANSGATWLVGNEPDVPWQDNLTPERYAALYHDVYTFIQERDPSAQIGAGGVALATPLRLAYLDAVLSAYRSAYGEPMPVDIWSLHAFVLREERDSWGIGIPPGSEAAAGLLYEVADHGDLALLETHVRDFRTWMARNGYQATPLALTEFGILLPADYGFPHEFVAEYQRGAFDFLMSATGEDGDPADGGRLVQWWFWYSLRDPDSYPTGDLFDAATGRPTALGEVYSDYLRALPGQ